MYYDAIDEILEKIMALPAISTETAEPQASIYTKMEAAGSLEEQFTILACALQNAEATYNNAQSPATPLNAIQVEPDYESRSLSVTASLLLSIDAADKSCPEAVVEYIV